MHARFAQRGFTAMGCRFEVLLDRAHESLDPGAIDAVAIGIEELVMDWHHRLSAFDRGSITAMINRVPARQPVRIDPEMYALCAFAERMRVISGGCFSIAAGTMMHALGFRDESIDDLGGLDLQRALTLDERCSTITRNDERVRVDFGGIAKGFVLDLVRAELMEYGIGQAFVHGGTSSVIAMGRDADGNDWRVRTGSADLRVGGYGVGISEPTGREVIDGVDRVGHLVDPRDGVRSGKRLIGEGFGRATIVHESAAVADALSTAVCVDAAALDLALDGGVGRVSCVVRGSDGMDHVLHDGLGIVSGLD